MEDRDDKRETDRLVRLGIALGAIVGLIIGVELLAGLGTAALIIGGLVGSGLGATFAYCETDSVRRGRMDATAHGEFPEVPDGPNVEPAPNEPSAVGKHVSQLNEQRAKPRNEFRDR